MFIIIIIYLTKRYITRKPEQLTTEMRKIKQEKKNEKKTRRFRLRAVSETQTHTVLLT